MRPGRRGFSPHELWELNLNSLRYALAETAVRRRVFLEFEAAAKTLGIAEGQRK